MKVIFSCPECDTPAQMSLDASSDWRCPQCQHPLHLEKADPALATCAVCGNHELYKKKDFPHGWGMVVLLVACAASFYTYLWYNKWLTWAILIGTAVFDGVLFLCVGDALVCYRCNAHYRRITAGSAHLPFELAIGERYRQERLRRERMKSGGS